MHPRLLSDLADLERAAAQRAAAQRPVRRRRRHAVDDRPRRQRARDAKPSTVPTAPADTRPAR